MSTATDTIDALEAKLVRTADVTQRAAIKGRLTELREAEEAAAAAKLVRQEAAAKAYAEGRAALALAHDEHAQRLTIKMREELSKVFRAWLANSRAMATFIAARERRNTADDAARDARGGAYSHSSGGPYEHTIEMAAEGIVERAADGLGEAGIDAAILAAVNELVGGHGPPAALSGLAALAPFAR